MEVAILEGREQGRASGVPRLALNVGEACEALVFGATAVKPSARESVRRRSLAAWEAENDRRVEAADDPEDVARLSPLTLHEARHTCASLMIAAGVNAKALSVIMGTRRSP
jgi:integrase